MEKSSDEMLDRIAIEKSYLLNYTNDKNKRVNEPTLTRFCLLATLLTTLIVRANSLVLQIVLFHH